ncbi:acetyltransferase [Maribacter arenosus]|uniref:Acetyltransferase n=1 Tax=Maribacter arenosus TaxID=1854708 RepID=A0ABR7VA91_9FLAO|nr:acetyltransferase [Maribacter arenosus]
MNIYGASGHAKVVLDIAKSINLEIAEVYDDNAALKEVAGFRIQQPQKGVKISNVVITIGNNAIRKRIAQEKVLTLAACLVHPSVQVGGAVSIGEGTVLMPNVVVNNSAKIGKNCILNTASVIEHDCELGDFVHLSPNAALAGGVSVGEGTHIGANAVVIPCVKIGKWAVVGAGAVILRDIPDYAVVVGNPGKIIKYGKRIHG